ncbi:conjugal transfer protein [Sphingobium sp. C100]|uniref:S26 family signal peptidase n=1 Tax=Sphingobium sp. C100 TaxID=1207055 RepID=UPI0003D6730D|nr:S26 family signal peptidase [Sphingobium sp. C100]ETI64969.1 conjugal transfer protein [Sphingobium sp. C100]
MNRVRLGAVSGLGLVAIAASVWLQPEWRLVFNPSASAPRGWYWVSPLAGPPRVGDHVLVWPPEWAARLADARRYVPATVPLMKPVAATVGALVCRDGATVRIDGRAVGMARLRDSLERPMPVWRGCRRLGPGQTFLLAAPESSFDGRYFGPVSTDRVIARVEPLWTW